MKAVSASTMKGLDETTIAAGTSGEELMERAGYGAFLEILSYCESKNETHADEFLILTGKGNNGGDGYVIARYLIEIGQQVTIVSTCPVEELHGDALLNAERVGEDALLIISPESLDEFFSPGTIIIDALLGTGISGELREPYASYIEQVNGSHLPVISIDVPSGLNADDGSVEGGAILADLTVCIGLPKAGLFLGEGSSHCGEFRLVEIGILPEAVDKATSPFDITTAADVSGLIDRLPAQAHKGTMGRVMVIGGSKWFPGALALAGAGCLRSGGGLVTLAFPESIGPQMSRSTSALIMHPVPDAGLGHHSKSGLSSLIESAGMQDTLVIGPGLSSESGCIDVVTNLLELDLPVVLDADGLRAFSVEFKMPDRSAPLVITPHPGEMRRLLEWIDRTDLLDAPRQQQALEVAGILKAHVVLKGTHTVVAGPDGRLSINSSGSVALATGGTGDVLSGMIAAWLCRLDDPFAAVRVAVFIHGFAAERVLCKRSFIADDLPLLIGDALAEISPHA